ncbi:MAG: gamma-glutamylcyclotransferase [Xanthobacteraceae bacterium]|nr:gamma-glutamylcyclotransferase [Xanthobacteraceae bacterium]MBX3547982.1 gamma-glutamylcyclotransferase [Xanthobacteraceae bacterium]
MRLYFAYGSNMDRAHMARLCPLAEAYGVASLRSYKYVIAASGYATVIPWPGSFVHGVLWKVGPKEIAALDRYEDVAGGLYRAVQLPVKFNERLLRALVYLASGDKTGAVPAGYIEKIVAAAKDWNLPADYIDYLSKQESAGGKRLR